MSLRPVLRAGAAGGLVALAFPAVAYAGALTQADPAKDVQKITGSGSGDTITNVPDNKTADIVLLSARYGQKRFRETVRLRDLGGHWFLRSRIRTASRHFDLVLLHKPGSNRLTLTRGKRQTQVVCDGLLPQVDRTRHTVSATVPADCLFAPHWVRIGAGFVKRGGASGVSYADDALRLRGISEANLTLSRKIHRS